MPVSSMRRVGVAAIAAVAVIAPAACSSSNSGSSGSSASPSPSAPAAATPQQAMDELVATPEGPPGVLTLTAIGDAEPVIATAGSGDIVTKAPIGAGDITRIASVAKAFSGAAALTLVRDGKLSVTSTVGESVKGMPKAWSKVTVAQLLQHTGGVPDYIKDPKFIKALTADLTRTWKPRELVSYVADKPLEFTPGSKYNYSDTDNIIIGLIVENISGLSYEKYLESQVYTPLSLGATSLPSTVALPTPYVNGYSYGDDGTLENVSEFLSPSGAWASGGILSTATDLNRFIRGYAGGQLVGATAHTDQFSSFVAGESGPPGPGENSSGLGIFQYKTVCGAFYGHSGNFPGYTTFIAANEAGTNSAVVVVNKQMSPTSDGATFDSLRKVFEAAVCAIK